MPKDYSPAIEMFTKQLMSSAQIAKRFNVSRQVIWKYLRKSGVDTRKGILSISCHTCAKVVHRARCRIRSHIYNFCSNKCYFEYIKNPNYNQHRQGQRIARQVFEKEVCFTHDWVIHHVDGNTDNNDLSNLWAFKSHSDHMRYHRGGTSLALKASSQKWEQVSETK